MYFFILSSLMTRWYSTRPRLSSMCNWASAKRCTTLLREQIYSCTLFPRICFHYIAITVVNNIKFAVDYLSFSATGPPLLAGRIKSSIEIFILNCFTQAHAKQTYALTPAITEWKIWKNEIWDCTGVRQQNSGKNTPQRVIKSLWLFYVVFAFFSAAFEFVDSAPFKKLTHEKVRFNKLLKKRKKKCGQKIPHCCEEVQWVKRNRKLFCTVFLT